MPLRYGVAGPDLQANGPGAVSVRQPAAYGHSLNVSSWGGSILRGDLWVSKMAQNCGLTAWLYNSMITRATAGSPMGPFTKRDTPLGVFAHKVVPLRAPASFGTGA